MRPILSLTIGITGAVALALLSAPVQAQVIRSPVAVLQNTGGDNGSDADIGQTIDHSGLFTDFTNGVTDYDTYIAGDPQHDWQFVDNEWFTPNAIKTSTIIYDLGALYSVNRMALWNENEAGINTLTLEASTVADFSSSVNLGAFNPTDNPDGANYGPDDFGFGALNARYFRLTVTNTNPVDNFVAMGEIAFRTSDPIISSAAPEPGTLALLGAGLAMVGMVTRRKR